MVEPLFIVISGTSGVGKDTVYRGIAPLTLKNKILTDQQKTDLDSLNRTVALEDNLDGLITQEELNRYAPLPELESCFAKDQKKIREMIKDYRTGVLNRLYPVLPIWIARSDASRDKKPGETEDLYKFITPDEFEKGIEKGIYLEWAIVYKTYKGTPLSRVKDVLKEGKIPIKLVDPQGAKSISEYVTDVFKPIIICLDAPDDILLERLLGRGRDSREEIETRLGDIMKDRKILNSIYPQPIFIQNTGKIKETRMRVYDALLSLGVNF